MNRKKSADADKLLEKLAVSSPNDAVKLLYLGAEDISELEGLDLSLLSEIKRGPKGEVELKFVNKLAIIRELIELNAAAAAQQAQQRADAQRHHNGQSEVQSAGFPVQQRHGQRQHQQRRLQQHYPSHGE